jgi:hypothetical protein
LGEEKLREGGFALGDRRFGFPGFKVLTAAWLQSPGGDHLRPASFCGSEGNEPGHGFAVTGHRHWMVEIRYFFDGELPQFAHGE